ncbi:MAG TPA: thioredoxin domain-containing protein [Kofleriaceae bacterium]
MLLAPLLAGGACEKKTKAPDTGAVTAMDHAGSSGSAAPTAPEAPADNTPLAGIDTSKLPAEKQALFFTLVNSLRSPCGKAHSLRTSFTSDTSCKRAPFAVRYVVSLLEDDASEQIARDEYSKHYEKQAPIATLDLSKAPHIGPADAPIKLVECFDYECPHCAVFKGAMEQILADEQGKISVSFLMFPIVSKHPDAHSAAQAALAADQQGKFKEMHDRLFAETPKHSKDAVMGYAKDLGLDLKKFAAAYDATSGQVDSDLAQSEAAGVDSTPTLFFQGRKYEGPMIPKYIEMWIDEELAVNR